MLETLDESKIADLNKKIRSPIEFARIMLGIRLHPSQVLWVNNANKRINILRPGNRWGKTLVAGILHVWHAMCKPMLGGKVTDPEVWFKAEYQTLNFGPTYELGRAALVVARDICEGNFLLPTGQLNKSMLAGWAIINDHSESAQLPYLEFRTGAKVLGRSYSEMGTAFKMKALAYISGDECADINELWVFTNNTLLPRLTSYDGIIHLVGTPQPEGHDYMRMIEMAEEDMERKDWKKNGLFYTQKGSMYENIFLPQRVIQEIEMIADPIMRKQIIYGEYVETGDKYFGFDRVQHSVDTTLELIPEGLANRRYVTAVDFAGGESEWSDYTVIVTVDYTEEPYKLVNFRRFKANEVSIPMQYQLVEEVYKAFPGTLIIDSSALGGRNALAFLGHLRPIGFEMMQKLKAEMLATLKIVLDGGQSGNRKRIRETNEQTGKLEDRNPNWGLLRFPDIQALVSELQNYRLDDKKIRTDCVMALGMAIHWIEMRRPKIQPRQAVDFDFLSFV